MNDNEGKQGEQYALLTSVGDYRKMRCASLTSWKNDRELMQKGLIDGLKFNPDNIRTLGEDGFVSGKAFARAMADFSKMLREDDCFLFYFSGHGRDGALGFSDMQLRIQSVLEVIEKLPAKAKIVILDCCYAGDFHVNGIPVLTMEDSIRDFVGSGMAVLASSSADEVSRMGIGGKHSLYTGAVSMAMRSKRLIRKGTIALPELAGEVQNLMQLWGLINQNHRQQPIFRTNMGGTIYFKVTDYQPYQPLGVFRETEHYTICAVKPMSTMKVKRLTTFVISKGTAQLQDLPAMTKEIAATIKDANVFASERNAVRFGDSPARVIWCYFGRDNRDIQQHNYFAHTIWAADEEARKLNYREDKNTKIVDDIYVYENKNYENLRRMMQPELSREDFIHQTKQQFGEILTLAERFIAGWREFENHTLTMRELKANFAEWKGEVRKQFLKLTNGEVPPDDLREWNEAVENMAGCVVDFAAALDNISAEGDTLRDSQTMLYVIRRYYEGMDKLKDYAY